MNASEQIVEAYFQLCRKCFTMADVKVKSGNNRQFDLLAVNLLKNTAYHIETTATHREQHCPKVEHLEKYIDRKFRGTPAKRLGSATDFSRGKAYSKEIALVYERFGLKADRVVFVVCVWTVKDPENISRLEDEYAKKGQKLEILLLRDKVLRELFESIGTHHYDSPVIRTISLIQQGLMQLIKAKRIRID